MSVRSRSDCFSLLIGTPFKLGNEKQVRRWSAHSNGPSSQSCAFNFEEDERETHAEMAMGGEGDKMCDSAFVFRNGGRSKTKRHKTRREFRARCMRVVRL